MTRTNPNEKTRRPVAALFLSLAATGLGHIYCGKLAKGLTLFFISFAFAPIIAASMRSASSMISMAAVIISILVLVFIFIYAAVDAFVLARRISPNYTLREYNRWYIYLLFITVAISYPTNLANHTREHIVQAYKIPSLSMAPGILKNDYLFLNKTVYKQKRPQRGDVVVFTYPNDRRIDYIKRIVAMPGDTVEIRDHVLLINDVPLAYQKLERRQMAGLPSEVTGEVMVEKNANSRYHIIIDRAVATAANMEKRQVPNGYCFVLGDNRSACKDSRHFGPVPLADIKGRVDYIYLPAASWSRFGKYGS